MWTSSTRVNSTIVLKQDSSSGQNIAPQDGKRCDQDLGRSSSATSENEDTRVTRSKAGKNQIMQDHTNIMQGAAQNDAVKCWNRAPLALKNTKSLFSVKQDRFTTCFKICGTGLLF